MQEFLFRGEFSLKESDHGKLPNSLPELLKCVF